MMSPMPSAPPLKFEDQSRKSVFKALPQEFLRASHEWIDDNAPRLGASLAFHALLALAPIIVFAVVMATVIYGRETALGLLTPRIQSMAGAELAKTIQTIIVEAYKPGTGLIATILGLATLLFAASTLFLELQDAMNTIWHVPLPIESTHTARLVRLIRGHFVSFAAILVIGFLFLILLGLNAWILAMKIAVPPATTFILYYLVIAALFAALYKILPNVALEWGDVALGGMITALLFLIGKKLLGLYFTNSSFGAAYSAAGSPIVVLFWMYYSAQLFFWGAEFCKVYAKSVGSKSSHNKARIAP